jgi:hypothetical protein
VLPNLVVIGAMKCATTSLHYYLGLHPEISMAAEKELHFFVAERNWPKGRAWYERQFAGRAAVYGESSTTYARFPHYSGVAERMHALLPEARLVYVVRDPVDRAVSHYVHEYAAGREDRPLAEALGAPNGNPYLDLSRYASQIEQYLPYYSRERILVLSAEDLGARRAETLRRVFAFLGVRESFHDPRFASVKHVSESKRRLSARGKRLAALPASALGQKLPPRVRRLAWRLLSHPFSSPMETPVVAPDLRRRLLDRLHVDVERFHELTGQPVDAWLR